MRKDNEKLLPEGTTNSSKCLTRSTIVACCFYATCLLTAHISYALLTCVFFHSAVFLFFPSFFQEELLVGRHSRFENNLGT